MTNEFRIAAKTFGLPLVLNDPAMIVVFRGAD
jgi:hypothetical protein